MANTDTPWGLKPLFMTEARKTAMLLPITNNYGTALYTYDPVTGVTAGTIEIAPVTGAILCMGTILGLYRQGTPKSLSLERLLPVQYMAASPGATYNYFALVTMDPNLYFVMQEDGVTTPLSAAMCFSNCDFIFTHTGDTTTGISGCEIDSNTMAVTATLAVRIIRPWLEYYDTGGNSYNAVTATAGASWCKWVVRINNYQFGDNTLGLA
jgi:hypothetical protein